MKHISLASLTILLLASSVPAHASDFIYDGFLSQKMIWESNPMMLSSTAEDLYGSSTTADFTATTVSPLWELDFNGTTTQNIFNQSRLNSTDLSGGIDLKGKTLNTKVGLSAEVSKETTRTSEISNFGRSLTAIDRLRYRTMPYINVRLNPSYEWGLASSYLKTEYDSDAYVNYQKGNILPSLTYHYSEDLDYILRVDYGQYHADNLLKSRIDTYALTLGAKYQLTPQMTATARGGYNLSKTREKYLTEQDWKRDLVYEASMAFQGEQNQIRLILNREQQPYADGTETLLTTMSLNASQQLNKSFNINGTALYQDAGASSASTLKHKLVGRIGLEYEVLSDLSLDISYQYHRENYNDGTKDAQNNTGMLTMTWRPFE